MIGRSGARGLVVLTLACLLAGCVDQDPFGLAERPVAGQVSLLQWEDFQTYYLVAPDREDDGGLVDGTVQRIGWNERYILVSRRATLGGGLGWMVVDGKLGTVAGPYSESSLRGLAEVRGIRTMPAAEAWDRLPTHMWRLWTFVAAVVLTIGWAVRRRRRLRM